MLNIYYYSATNDVAAKKKNKALADAAKATIKEYGCVEVWSSKTNNCEMKISDADKIIPYWGSISFELDDEMDPSLCEKRGLIKEIVAGKIVDTKHENQEINGIDKIIV